MFKSSLPADSIALILVGCADTPQRRPLPEETETDTRNRRSDHDATTVTTTRKPRDNKEPFTMAYYPSWITMDLSTVDFTPYDWIDFAFAVPTEDFGLAWNEQQHEATVKQIVAKAHQGETKVKISIGGWSGSKSVFQFLVPIISLNTND